MQGKHKKITLYAFHIVSQWYFDVFVTIYSLKQPYYGTADI
jgi:hypothetical protein